MLNYIELRKLADKRGESQAKGMYPPGEQRIKAAKIIADREYGRMITPRYTHPYSHPIFAAGH